MSVEWELDHSDFKRREKGGQIIFSKKHGGKGNKKIIAIASEIGVQRKHERYFTETETTVSLGKNSGKGLDVVWEIKSKEIF